MRLFLLAGALSFALAAGQPAMRVAPTDASWADAEGATATVSARTIPPATIASCQFQGTSVIPLVTTPYFELTWTFPPGSGYTATSNLIVKRSATAGLGGVLEPITGGSGLRTTGPVNGVYTTQIDAGLLGNLLGGSFNLAIVAKQSFPAVTWEAAPATVTAQANLAGLTGSCTR